jgi:hypothetical protein
MTGQIEDDGGVDRLADVAGFDNVEAPVAKKHCGPSGKPASLRRIEDLHSNARSLRRANLRRGRGSGGWMTAQANRACRTEHDEP